MSANLVLNIILFTRFVNSKLKNFPSNHQFFSNQSKRVLTKKQKTINQQLFPVLLCPYSAFYGYIFIINKINQKIYQIYPACFLHYIQSVLTRALHCLFCLIFHSISSHYKSYNHSDKQNKDLQH